MDDLRTLLHTLADRIAVVLEPERAGDPATAASSPSAPSPRSTDDARDPARAAALDRALRALAEGDLSTSHLQALGEGRDAEYLGAAVQRARELVHAARASVAGGSAGLDELRAAAERVADGASRQRVTLERATEQLRQLAQRVSEFAAAAGEIADAADRASLLALNTGIEGLRVGGEVARALAALGDEMRKLTQRAAGGARELSTGLRAASDQARASAGAIDDARGAARQGADDAARLASSAEAVRRADAGLGTVLDGFRVLDDETDALVANLGGSAERLARQVAQARARLATTRADSPAAAALRDALARLESAVRPREDPSAP